MIRKHADKFQEAWSHRKEVCASGHLHNYIYNCSIAKNGNNQNQHYVQQ